MRIPSIQIILASNLNDIILLRFACILIQSADRKSYRNDEFDNAPILSIFQIDLVFVIDDFLSEEENKKRNTQTQKYTHN